MKRAGGGRTLILGPSKRGKKKEERNRQSAPQLAFSNLEVLAVLCRKCCHLGLSRLGYLNGRSIRAVKEKRSQGGNVHRAKGIARLSKRELYRGIERGMPINPKTKKIFENKDFFTQIPNGRNTMRETDLEVWKGLNILPDVKSREGDYFL